MLNLTDKLRSEWENQGYLHIPGVLKTDEIINLRKIAEDVIENYETQKLKIQSSAQGNTTLGAHNHQSYNILQAIEYTEGFDCLLDHPVIFGLITDIMGVYLQVSGCDLFIRHPSTEISALNQFHTDGGPSLQKILPQKNTPPLLIKMQYFLTDLNEEYSGNLTVVPGSHLKPVLGYNKNCLVHDCNKYVEKGVMPPDAKQILVKAGDVVIHAWTLWHAVSPNRSNVIRKSVSVRYSQLWSRPYYQKISKEIMTRLTMRQKRLLGDIGEDATPTEYYTPPNQTEIIMDY